MTMLPHLRFLPAAIIMLTLSGRIEAQTPPGNVNDCTLIQDPIALRNCILRYGNVRTQPPATIETTVPPAVPRNDPLVDPADGIVEIPSKSVTRTSGTAKRSDKVPTQKTPIATAQSASAAQTAPPPRPNPKDTIIHIEQITIPKIKR